MHQDGRYKERWRIYFVTHFGIFGLSHRSQHGILSYYFKITNFRFWKKNVNVLRKKESKVIIIVNCFKFKLPSCILKWNLNQSSTNFIILFEILGHNLKLKINCIVQKGLCSWNEIFSTDSVKSGLKIHN